MLCSFDRSLELLDRVETENIKFLFYDLPARFSGTYKTYEYSRLCTIITGEKEVTVNQAETFHYNSEGLLLLAPNSAVKMKINQPTKALVLELSSEMIRQVREKVSDDLSIDFQFLPDNNFYVGTKNGAIRDVLNRITGELLKQEKDSKYLVDLYAYELVYRLIQDKGMNQIFNAENRNPVNRAIQYMNNNYTDPISIQHMADLVNMSETNFCHYSKKIAKVTPNQYLTRLKLEKSKELLKSESVTEVAFDLGYANISHFILLFKKRFGVTPKQYQMNLMDF